MFRVLVIFLQTLLAVAFVGGLFAQAVVIPTAAADEVAFFPPYESVQVPFVAFAIVFVACCQALLVALWGVLHRAGNGTVFESGALTWTNLAVGAVAAGAVVLGSVCGYVFFTDIPTPYDGMELLGLWMGSGAATIVAAVCALMLLIVRYWQRHAIAQRAELEQVL
ncbi:DUF2975 domain-containing protein [Lentzea kentuckyensis]|uniref:DUF2975 domain-containing protein n=1 Tax=Lentzea kentuckyensis TaxID=360086 RepID=UPI000A370DE3|nr:DUF2975 domain-containing protein [Lentzea kentuckyensis]